MILLSPVIRSLIPAKTNAIEAQKKITGNATAKTRTRAPMDKQTAEAAIGTVIGKIAIQKTQAKILNGRDAGERSGDRLTRPAQLLELESCTRSLKKLFLGLYVFLAQREPVVDA